MRYSRTIEQGMQPDSLGDWVRFEDYAELEAKLAAAEADAAFYRCCALCGEIPKPGSEPSAIDAARGAK